MLDGIVREREILNEIKSKATLLIDTTRLSPRQLREEIFHNFETSENTAFHINVMSFGFKYGIPIDADVVMDVRFLPNPYYVKELKEKRALRSQSDVLADNTVQWRLRNESAKTCKVMDIPSISSTAT